MQSLLIVEGSLKENHFPFVFSPNQPLGQLCQESEQLRKCLSRDVTFNVNIHQWNTCVLPCNEEGYSAWKRALLRMFPKRREAINSNDSSFGGIERVRQEWEGEYEEESVRLVEWAIISAVVC